jgi:hypothetical protein
MNAGAAGIARCFPLVARTRPACTPLAERVADLRERARTAERKEDRGEATAVLNLAALLASDLGMAQTARDWCHRHVAAYLQTHRLGPDGARYVLEPLINLARLHIRSGDGERAAQLVGELYSAVANRTDAVIDGIALPAAALDLAPDGHREIRRWLWAVMLATTARALATVGNWSGARAALAQSKGIGNRMLDGRQIAVLERADAGDTDGALALVHTTESGEPWERAVTLCLNVLCSDATDAREARELLETYRALPTKSPGLAVFHTRLGLAVIDTLGGPQSPACRQGAKALIGNVINGVDGYAARDLLAHPVYQDLMTTHEARQLADRVGACALGAGAMPAELHAHLSAALDTSEGVIIRASGAQPSIVNLRPHAQEAAAVTRVGPQAS